MGSNIGNDTYASHETTSRHLPGFYQKLIYGQADSSTFLTDLHKEYNEAKPVSSLCAFQLIRLRGP
jgi:hypothetical protein